MSFSQDLLRDNESLWTAMVTHPFVKDLGKGTLPKSVFARYLLQDYLFLKALVKLTALGIARAPDFEAARRLDAFLSPVLTGEEELFRRAFEAMEVSSAEVAAAFALPTTTAFDSFLTSVAYDGTFEEVLTCLFVTEGTYVDWAQQLKRAGLGPSNSFYQEWIDIHAARELASFVGWVRQTLDASPKTAHQWGQLKEVFRTALRYEVAFWRMAYEGESWEAVQSGEGRQA